MASEQSIRELLLRIKSDQAALNKTIADLKRAEEATERVASATDKVGKEAGASAETVRKLQAQLRDLNRASAVDKIIADFKAASLAGEDLDGTMERVTAELDAIGAKDEDIRRVARAMRDLSEEARKAAEIPDPTDADFGFTNAAPTGGRRRRNETLVQIGTQIRDLPAIGIPGAGFSTDVVGKVLRSLGALGVPIQALGIAAGVAAPLLIGATVAIGEYNKQLEASIERARLFGEALSEAFGAGTTKAIEDLRAARQKELETAQQTRDALIKQAQEAQSTFQATTGEIDPSRLPGSIANAPVAAPLLAAAVAIDKIDQFVNGRVNTQLPEQSETTIEGYNAEIERQNKIIADAQVALDAYNVVLGDSGTAANDAAVVLLKLRDGFQETAESVQEQAAKIQQALHTMLFRRADDARSDFLEDAALRTGTSQAAQARADEMSLQADAIREAIRVIQSSGVDTEATRKQIEDYRSELRELESDQRRINEVIMPYLTAKEHEAQLIAQQVAAINTQIASQTQLNNLLRTATPESIQQRALALQNEAASLQAVLPQLRELAPTNQAYADQLRAATLRVAEINNELTVLSNTVAPAAIARAREALVAERDQIAAAALARVNEILAQAEQKVAEAQAAIEDKRLEILEKANDEAAKIADQYGIDRKRAEEDLARELSKINSDILDATAERDALAAFQAEKRLDEAEADADLEAKRRQEDFDRRLKEIAIAADKEFKTIQDQKRKEIDTIRAGADAAVQLERQKAENEIQLRQQALNNQLQLTAAALTQEQQLFAEFWAATLQLAGRSVEAVNSMLSSTGRNIVQPDTIVVDDPFAAGILQRAGGGQLPANRLTLVGERGPEFIMTRNPGYVFNHEQTRQMMQGGGGMQNTFNINAPTIQAVISEVSTLLYKQLAPLYRRTP